MKEAAPHVLVWDMPTRVFHVLLVVSFAGAYATGDSERWRVVHATLGYTAGALVLFRLAWGIAGTRYARFDAWRPSPHRAIAYLRSLASGSPEHHVGHNPAGSIAMCAMLGLVLATALTGLASLDEIGGDRLEDVHEVLATAMLALVAVHLAGVVVGSIVHRENLVLTMLTGRKRARHEDAITGARPLVALALFVAVIGMWAGWVPTPGMGSRAELSAKVEGRDARRHAHPERDDD